MEIQLFAQTERAVIMGNFNWSNGTSGTVTEQKCINLSFLEQFIEASTPKLWSAGPVNF